MTGHRRKTGRPLRAVATEQRSRAHFEAQLAQAQRPGHRVAVVAAYLRAVLARADQQMAELIEQEASAELLALARKVEAATVAAAHRRLKEAV